MRTKVESDTKQPTYMLTQEGHQQFIDKQAQLAEERRVVVEQINHLRTQQASEFTDLVTTIDALQKIDNELVRVEHILKNASIYPVAQDGNVHLGAQVTLQSEKGEVMVKLVESIEADPLAGRISVDSPLGKAIIGKQLQDQIEVPTSKGTAVYQLLAIA